MVNQIRVAGIVDESIVDGPGIRLTVFVQGCSHNCEGCHNPESHAFDGGNIISVDSIIEMIEKNPLLDGITISGGEPFQQASGCATLAKIAKGKGLHVMTYTGYTFENIMESVSENTSEGVKMNTGWRALLENSDVLVDGPFVLAKRSLQLRFRGSHNQRIIDVKKSIDARVAVLIC